MWGQWVPSQRRWCVSAPWGRPAPRASQQGLGGASPNTPGRRRAAGGCARGHSEPEEEARGSLCPPRAPAALPRELGAAGGGAPAPLPASPPARCPRPSSASPPCGGPHPALSPRRRAPGPCSVPTLGPQLDGGRRVSPELRATLPPPADHDAPSPVPPERGAPSAGGAEDRARLPRGHSGALPWGRGVRTEEETREHSGTGAFSGSHVPPSLDAQRAP